MKKKKTVTLPRVFHPGPGHPAETLAYLNPFEHQLIKRMTDGTASRGPHGIRSYSVTTGTTTGSSNTGGSGAAGDRSGGPGGGSLQAPARTAPSSAAVSSPNANTQTGGKTASTSTSNNPTGGSLQAPARTAPSTIGNTSNTALGKVSQAAQANIQNPVSLSGSLDNGYYHSFRDTLPGMNNPNQFSKSITSTGLVNSAHVPMDTWSKGYDPNKLQSGAQSIHQAIVDNALRTNTPVDFFSGKSPRKGTPQNPKGTPQHPAGQAIDIRLRDPTTGAFVGYDKIGSAASNPIGKTKAIQDALSGPYRNFASGVMNSFMTNPGVYGAFDNQRWGGAFSTSYPADYMHFDEGKVNPAVSAEQTAFRREAANYRGPASVGSGTMLAGGVPTGNVQVASISSPSLGQAAALDKAKKAADFAQKMGAGIVQGSVQPPAPIPSPKSVGFLGPPPTATITDFRVGLPTGAFPTAPRSAAGTYTSPYDRLSSQMASDPRVGLPTGAFPSTPQNPIGGMSFNPGLPSQMPPSAYVATDPRVSLTPLGSLPAAPRQAQVAWNVPPMGGAVNSYYGDNFAGWGVNRPAPPDPNHGATPGVSGSMTASAAPTTTPAPAKHSNSYLGGVINTISAKASDVKQAIKTMQENPAVQKINAIAKTNPGLAGALVNIAMGLGGGHPGSSNLGNAQDRSSFIQPVQQAQSQQPMGGNGGANSNPLSVLMNLQKNMIAKGASAEELAYVQSLIDALSKSKVA